MKDKSEFVYYRVSRKESESFENVNIGYGRLEPRNIDDSSSQGLEGQGEGLNFHDRVKSSDRPVLLLV